MPFVLLLCLLTLSILVFLVELIFGFRERSTKDILVENIFAEENFLETITQEGKEEVLQKYNEFVTIFGKYSM
jgi:hypothetical protein